MNRRAALAWLRSLSPWLLLLYIAGSSLLGLSLGISGLDQGHPLFSLGTLSGVLWFWTLSIPADVVFVAGTASVAAFASRWDAPKLLLLVAASFASLATYELAFALWSATVFRYGGDGTTLVIFFGYPGLLFAGLAPVAWRLLRERRRRAALPALAPAG